MVKVDDDDSIGGVGDGAVIFFFSVVVTVEVDNVVAADETVVAEASINPAEIESEQKMNIGKGFEYNG